MPAAMAKPINGPCEMSAGVDDNGVGIRVLLCRRPGVERPDMPNIVVPPIACDDCYEVWRARRIQG